jgi:HEAT repeat protein
LFGLLESADGPKRDDAARTLALMGTAVVPDLVELVETGNLNARCSAAASLAWMTEDADPGSSSRSHELLRALPALEKLLSDDDPRCRDAAVMALVPFGEDALPLLWRSLASPSETAIEAAERVAAGIGALAIPGLLEVARAETSVARAIAITCLREIATPAGVFGLSELGIPLDG